MKVLFVQNSSSGKRLEIESYAHAVLTSDQTQTAKSFPSKIGFSTAADWSYGIITLPLPSVQQLWDEMGP